LPKRQQIGSRQAGGEEMVCFGKSKTANKNK